MFHRAAAVVAAVLVTVLALGAPPAHAGTTAPTPLTLERATFEATVDAPPRGEPVVCDYYNYVFCGFVSIEVELSGLDGRERPGPGDYTWPLDAYGTVDLVRVYGCASRRGQRLPRYDTRVVERDYQFATRRGFPYPVPAGDTLNVGVYALLGDAQPGNCPARTWPRLYSLEATNAELRLDSQWTGIPASTTYAVPGSERWDGAARTPRR